MTPDQAVELSRGAVILALTVAAPVLLAAVAVGLFISIIQAVTQVQDQTVSFVPKIVAMLLTMLYFLPWALHLMTEYTTDLFHNVSNLM